MRPVGVGWQGGGTPVSNKKKERYIPFLGKRKEEEDPLYDEGAGRGKGEGGFIWSGGGKCDRSLGERKNFLYTNFQRGKTSCALKGVFFFAGGGARWPILKKKRMARTLVIFYKKFQKKRLSQWGWEGGRGSLALNEGEERSGVHGTEWKRGGEASASFLSRAGGEGGGGLLSP